MAQFSSSRLVCRNIPRVTVLRPTEHKMLCERHETFSEKVQPLRREINWMSLIPLNAEEWKSRIKSKSEFLREKYNYNI